MTDLLITEVFHSIQGESTWAGLPCVFIRLRGCHMRCHYCDTEYAFHQGARQSIDSLIDQVRAFQCKLVEVTGGEPLLQAGVHELMGRLCDAGHTVLLETGGGCDISPCDRRVIRVMDIKTPGSGEAPRNVWTNIDLLQPRDEIKFVLCDRADYDWAKEIIRRYELPPRVNAILMSAAAPLAPPPGSELRGVAGLALRDLAEWVIADRLPVRVQTQLHKIIWDPMARGV